MNEFINKLYNICGYEVSLEEAWDIAGDFGNYLEHNSFHFYQYESALPHPKAKIFSSFLKILAEDDFKLKASYLKKSEKELKNVIFNNMVILINSFIPDKDQYEERVKLMDKKNEK